MRSLRTRSAVRITFVLAILSWTPGSGDPGSCETWRWAGTEALGKTPERCWAVVFGSCGRMGTWARLKGSRSRLAQLGTSVALRGAAGCGAAPLPGGVPAECGRRPRSAARSSAARLHAGRPAAPSVVLSRLSWTVAASPAPCYLLN